MNVHPTARKFDGVADVYDRVRPGYPDEAVAWLLERLGHTVLDLAAGTGKLTRALARAGADVAAPTARALDGRPRCGLGDRLIAVEPSEPMLERLRVTLPEVEALVGSAEEIPLGEESVDAVTVAQAFHWFDHPRALAEIHRVLRPDGRFAIVWNTRDLDAPAHAFMEQLVLPHKHATPRSRELDSRAVMAASDLFEPFAEAEFRHEQQLPPGGLADRVASTSYIAALPDGERAAVLAEAERYETELGRPVVLPHTAELLVYARR